MYNIVSYLRPYCAWFPIAPILCDRNKHFILNRTIYPTTLKKYLGCYWYNNKKYDPIKLEDLDQYDDFFCDDYFINEEQILNRIKNIKTLSIEYKQPNVVFIHKEDNQKLCLLITPIDSLKTRIFIFFKQKLNKDSNIILEKKLLKYNIRLLLKL